MRYLGLDLGTKTLGVSISDVTRTVARALTTIRFEENDYESAIKQLAHIIESNSVGKIILGLPKNMNNSIGFRAQTALHFKKMLEDNFKIEVVVQDERLSTKEASSYMILANVSRKKRKQKIDALAANIILQTYLDKERNENNAKK